MTVFITYDINNRLDRVFDTKAKAVEHLKNNSIKNIEFYIKKQDLDKIEDKILTIKNENY